MGELVWRYVLWVLVVLAMLVLVPDARAQSSTPPAGDPIRGGRLFLQCRACHTVGAGERDGVGPNLHGIVGARAASRPGYAYSPALRNARLTWTPDVLDRFLLRPAAVVPGNRMSFAGVAAAQARQDLIAYLSKPPSPRPTGKTP